MSCPTKTISHSMQPGMRAEARKVPRGRHCAFVGKLVISCVVVWLTWLPVAAFAMNERDLQIVARTLGFLDPPLTGDVRVGILFDPDSTGSSQEAQSIQALMGAGMAVGNLVMRPVMVPLREAAGANVRFFLLAEDVSPSADRLESVIQQRQLPCLTTDLDQVRAGNCAVGIQSSPKVEILVNRETAAGNDVSFASVFRMMIREL